MRLAIADPPYPPQLSERYDTADGSARVVTRSRARRWYGDGSRSTEKPADFHPEAGEWDDPRRHRLLLEQLLDEYDGWAIATTPDGLRCYEPLPVPARLLVWWKKRAMPTGHRIASSWEPVILFPPRARRSRAAGGDRLVQVSDVLVCSPPGAGFPGAKPEAWTRWVLDAMGWEPDDVVDDLFPGSGAVARAAAQGVLV